MLCWSGAGVCRRDDAREKLLGLSPHEDEPKITVYKDFMDWVCLVGEVMGMREVRESLMGY